MRINDFGYIPEKGCIYVVGWLRCNGSRINVSFQNTILSLVASVQIASYDMVRIGDWIEMPSLNADGDVIDISLHTVTVQNFDKTYTTIPTNKLVTDTFKNWRGMSNAGCRRMKRSLYIDQTSVHFMTEEEQQNSKIFIARSIPQCQAI